MTQVVPPPYSGRVRVVGECRGAVAQADAAAPAPAPALPHAALQGYPGAKFIHEAIRRAGAGASRDQVVASIAAAGNFDLGDFTRDHTAKRPQGSRLVELSLPGREGRFP